MNRNQFDNKHRNLSIEKAELDRKWRMHLREQEEMLLNEAAINSQRALASSGGGAGPGLIPVPESDGRYYIRLLDGDINDTIMFDGFFYVDADTHIVQRFYDSTNPTVDIRSTGGNGGPTYLYYPGWLCFDGGGCNITSFPYLYGVSTGDYNLYGSTNSSTGNNVDGYNNVTYLFSLTPFI